MGDRRMLGAALAGALAVGLIWWSPSVDGSSTEAEREAQLHAEPDLDAARALAAVLVDHLGGALTVSGGASDDWVSASAYASGRTWDLRLIVDPGAVHPAACSLDGRRRVDQECRTLADGSVLEASSSRICGGVRDPRAVLLGVLGDNRLADGLTPALVDRAEDVDGFVEEHAGTTYSLIGC